VNERKMGTDGLVSRFSFPGRSCDPSPRPHVRRRREREDNKSGRGCSAPYLPQPTVPAVPLEGTEHARSVLVLFFVLPPHSRPSRNKQKKREHDTGRAFHEEKRIGGVQRRLPDTIGGGRSLRLFHTRFVHGIAGVTSIPHRRSGAGST